MIHGSLLAISLLCGSASAEWTHRPGDVRVCNQDNAAFRWNLDQNTAQEVTHIFWMNMRSGISLMGWYRNTGSTHAYDPYVGRVRLLEGTNAGILLENVTESDRGMYRIEMSGSGDQDVAELFVYSYEDLKPSVLIENEAVEFNSKVDMRNVSETTITVKTAGELPANIMVEVYNQSPVKCVDQSLCSSLIMFQDIPVTNFTINISVYYGICQPHHVQIYIWKSPAVVGGPSVVAAVLPLLILLLTLAVLLLLWVYLRRKEMRTRGREPLPRCQKNYIHNRLCFRPMKTLTRWSSSAWGLDDDSKPRSGTHPETIKALLESSTEKSTSKEADVYGENPDVREEVTTWKHKAANLVEKLRNSFPSRNQRDDKRSETSDKDIKFHSTAPGNSDIETETRGDEVGSPSANLGEPPEERRSIENADKNGRDPSKNSPKASSFGRKIKGFLGRKSRHDNVESDGNPDLPVVEQAIEGSSRNYGNDSREGPSQSQQDKPTAAPRNSASALERERSSRGRSFTQNPDRTLAYPERNISSIEDYAGIAML